MKKIILACLVLTMAFAVQTKAQSTTPRFTSESGALMRGSDLFYTYHGVSDTNGTDTVHLRPTRWQNFYTINKGDTLNRRVCIKVADETVNGIVYNRTKSYAFDKLTVHYSTGGGQVDTIDWAGNMIVDTAGTGTNKTFIPKSTLKKTYFMTFIFDGANWVQESISK